jgi:uncharacterized membrane protein (UPF0127 family)
MTALGRLLAAASLISAVVAGGCARPVAPAAVRPSATPPIPAEQPTSAVPTPTTAVRGAAPSPTSAASPTPLSTAAPRYVDSLDCASVARQPLRSRTLELVSASLTVEVSVEVADTPENRGQGLMCRADVPPGTGMAFLWDMPTGASFWMFNTYVPLDILYVDGAGRVVAARTMTPCPRATGERDQEWTARCAAESRTYAAGADYAMAVELPAGWLAGEGLDLASFQDWRAVLRD